MRTRVLSRVPRFVHRATDAMTVQPSEPVAGTELLESLRATAAVVISREAEVGSLPSPEVEQHVVQSLALVLSRVTKKRCPSCGGEEEEPHS